MNTGPYTCLEIFAKENAALGSVRLLAENQAFIEKPAGKASYAWLKFNLQPYTEYQILCLSCDISLCYLSGNEDILETGVRYLEKNPKTGLLEETNPQAWYSHPARESYHFSPWKNWINDPNGLCWFQGYYHLFYQHNPHGQEWSNMYWGHAASPDLIHWTHLPLVLAPQEEILENPKSLKGGAFSGCAVAGEEEVTFYLTRHKGPQEDCPDTVEQQWMMKSRDMLHFTEETCVISQQPPGASFDFRDPKVQKIGDFWYMVLGSSMEGKGAILLYRSKDMQHWEYLHPLLTEEQAKIRCFECPDFMALDGSCLALGAWMEHTDSCGRYQMSRYYVGTWQEERFEKQQEGWFDFGGNCYAMQSFTHEGRRISIGWISDFYGEHTAYENGAYGSMTIPRELHIRNNRLYITPVREMELLRGRILYEGSEENLCLPQITGNAYRASIKFQKNTFFTVLLGKDGEKSLTLINDRDGLRLETRGVNSQGIRFQAEVPEVRELEIFVDRRTAEVYVNQGEAVGTKIFYSSSPDGCLELKAENPWDIAEAKVMLMYSIWH